MTVLQDDVVDFVSFERATGRPTLTISNHLDWSLESVYFLQEKINVYIAFIESGELVERFPAAANKEVVVSVVCIEAPNELGRAFLADAERTLRGIGVVFQVSVLVDAPN